ncbi:unnamed protein product [Rotaria sp. Silwood1]|nr:unnamed protein product [Rotaria sp. Silwood1]CAF4646942.1 unnamed protein product [Rotaria sp. Silwood1]
MLHENRNENLPMERDNSSNINENKSDEEEKMTSLSSLSIDQKSLKENRKRKLNDEIVKQQEEEEETQRLNYENLSDNEIKERLLKTIIYDFFLRIKVNQWLETDRTLLLFIRQHASLLVTYCSLKMELELYQSYINMTESLLP